jgi:hypothetical protein
MDLKNGSRFLITRCLGTSRLCRVVQRYRHSHPNRHGQANSTTRKYFTTGEMDFQPKI